MEYPFKDLLPLDEVLEREGYYKDWTHLDPEVFYSLTQISEYIKTKGFGVDVRLLIAQLAEHFGLKSTQIIDLANLLQQKFDNLEGVTQSFTNNINSLVAQMEADKDAVIANATVDSEVILARGGKETLGKRLDETDQKIDDIHINIKDYGAKSGDDITDILISLIEEEVTIFIPKGNYIFSRPIKTRKRVRIKGFDSKHTTLRYQPVIDDGSTALEVMSLNWDSEILTIENIYLRDESNETNTFISVGHSDDGQNFTWGARVRVENSAIRNYKNVGLHVVAPYNNLISNSTFRGKAVSESLPSTLTPVTNGVGIYFTGSSGNIQTFGNVNRIVDTNFGDNIYGVELENIHSTYFDNCTFENNWISAYLHSDDSTDKYKGSTNNLFTNCWFEDKKNGHPDLYIVDCKMDKATGQYDTSKEIASSTTSINSNFVYKNMGLPASKGFNMGGTHWTTDNPDQYLFRQWDRKWELGGGGKTDGVVTKIGGKAPYFRGVLGLNKGIEHHSASIASSKPANKLTENVEIFDIRLSNPTNNVFEYSIDLSKLTQPELFDKNYINHLRSKITIVARSEDWNKAVIETDCLFYAMSGRGESRDSYKTVFSPSNQINLKKVDTSVTEDNNNMGLRIVRSGSTLTLKFHISGFKGGTVYMENKYLTNFDTNLL